ncbi:MAG TPA: DUF485 domain-containing protein [Rhodospirillaceae bacterium]|nr:hypothetical protein [Candidatus Neomarinimicrobiota bacterium]HCX14203.1 DUF485 domain-containing protein [Rhodospirillaceae bacterium]
MTDETLALRKLARQRWNMGISLSAVMVVIYFGFILLVAFHKKGLGSLIIPGLSVGIVLGALVIVLTWTVTWFYVRWANIHIDTKIERLNTKNDASSS